MTRFARTNHGKGHGYTLEGHRIPGVTTVIGKVLDKPALVEWAARETARYAIDNWATLTEQHPLDRFEALKGARWETNRAAVVAGNQVHDLGERLAHGKEVDVPDYLRGRVEAYARFLDDWDIEMLATESPVCHTGYRYGGTLDMIGRVGRLDGQTLLMDIKTGRRAYSETALQLCAYQHADLRLESVEQPPGPRGGKRKPLLVERPMIPTDGAAVIHVVAETAETPARVDLLPVDTGADVWRSWLYILELYRIWHLRCDDKGSDVYAPPVGEPIYPGAESPFYDEDEGDS